MIQLEIRGDDELQKTFKKMEDNAARAVGFAAVKSAIKLMRNEGVKLSPGRVKLEWGSKIRSFGQDVVGSVGLGVGGYRAKVKRPHGHYLNNGTQTIAARHFVETAFQAARQRVAFVMKRAASKRLKQLTEGAT